MRRPCTPSWTSLAGTGVRSEPISPLLPNAIAPALIETQMLANLPKAQPERIPVGRFGTAEEVAEVALMLACNGYVTGQTIQVNGGLYMT